jgi:hypothetical protein
MDVTKTIDAQVTLPIDLYQAIAQQAQVHGHSVSNEIVALLVPILGQNSPPNLQLRRRRQLFFRILFNFAFAGEVVY